MKSKRKMRNVVKRREKTEEKQSKMYIEGEPQSSQQPPGLTFSLGQISLCSPTEGTPCVRKLEETDVALVDKCPAPARSEMEIYKALTHTTTKKKRNSHRQQIRGKRSLQKGTDFAEKIAAKIGRQEKKKAARAQWKQS